MKPIIAYMLYEALGCRVAFAAMVTLCCLLHIHLFSCAFCSQALSSAGSSGSGLLHGRNVQHDSNNALLPNKGSEQSAGRPSPAAQWQLGQPSSLLSSSTPLQTPCAPIPVGQRDIPLKLHPSIPSPASLSSTRIIGSPNLAHPPASQVPALVSQNAQAAPREPECLDRNLNSLDLLLDSWMQPHAGSSQPLHGGI